MTGLNCTLFISLFISSKSFTLYISTRLNSTLMKLISWNLKKHNDNDGIIYDINPKSPIWVINLLYKSLFES